MAHPMSSPDPLAMRKARQLLNADLARYGWALFGISGLISVLALTGSFYMLQVYDRALASGSVQTLAFLSVLALALYLVQGGFDTIRSQLLVRIGARLDQAKPDRQAVGEDQGGTGPNVRFDLVCPEIAMRLVRQIPNGHSGHEGTSEDLS